MRNGVVSITLPADVSGNYTAALMFKRLGSNDALQPYQGATVSTSMSGGQATITYSGLAENYYCIVISSQGRCFNDDVELRCCPPTKAQWAQAKRHPLCSYNNGMIQYRLSNDPAVVGASERVYGQVRLTLMYRKLGTNDPLQPVPGAQVFTHDFGTTQDNRPQTQFVTFENLGPAYYCAIVQTYLGCFNIDIELDCRDYKICTYTQGGWGSAGGKMSDGATSRKYATTELITQSITNWGGTLRIGSQTSSGSWLTITTAQQVLDFLPNGGPSFILNKHTGGLSLSNFLATYNTKKGGALIAQTIALGLNLRIVNNKPDEQHLAAISLEGIVDPAVIAVLTDKTVGGLYAFANQVIGGTSGTMGLSLSQISDAIDAINNYFVECKVYMGPGSVMTASNPGVAVGGLSENLATKNENLKVVAGPNPFRGRVQFTLESAVSGQGVLEVYNVGGVRLATPFRGYVAAGKTQSISYEAPSLGGNGLLYVFRVNGEQTSGKLIAAK